MARTTPIGAGVSVRWETVETAPKDGTLIDVWVNSNNGNFRVTNMKWTKYDTPYPNKEIREGWVEFDWDVGDWSNPIEREFCISGRDGSPMWYKITHWMPLPESPYRKAVILEDGQNLTL